MEKPASPSNSGPSTPADAFADVFGSPVSPISGIPPALSGSTGGSPGSPGSPTSPGTPLGGAPFRRGHSRQTSLGTTNSSAPSGRRRSLDQTMKLIQDVVDGKDSRGEAHEEELGRMADIITSPARGSISSPTREGGPSSPRAFP